MSVRMLGGDDVRLFRRPRSGRAGTAGARHASRSCSGSITRLASRRSGSEVRDPGGIAEYVMSSRCEWTWRTTRYVVGPSRLVPRAPRVLPRRRTASDRAGHGSRTCFPVGEGLLPFTEPAKAAAALDDVERDYAPHARPAGRIAAEY